MNGDKPGWQLNKGCLSLHGDWTLPHYQHLHEALVSLPADGVTELDGRNLARLDTAAAGLLWQQLGPALPALARQAEGMQEGQRSLLLAVTGAMSGREPVPVVPARRGDTLARLGERVHTGWVQGKMLLGFTGLTLTTAVKVAFRPAQWRMTALVAQMHQCGLNAVPIVALLTFLVGAVVAFLGATVLANFGATIYTVDLVAYSFMREFGVLLTAILLAGRTASAFTAQLGSMKVNQELDALRAQGLDPIALLVLPRLLALLLTLPLLTFIAVLSGLLGGALVGVMSLDISPAHYLTIVREVPLNHLLVGLGKAPVFAVLIALIGCLEGFKVSGSAQSVGEHTTSSVVQSIFVVILLDAIAALFLMEMGW
ncbi:MlaE family ABC transporter permease [Oceanimonas baumannii]|uniref:ABC transporter permease n=1 Tax=Oceanimonas baumannii TaxID=129578 RepID=A0A235CIW8_9GAMM|nr:ABC transporter permease [Oceanimonas baumannii]OYD24551.1 ABC transporter permease [Oceanimonas baumannii]TDW59283.1 phospholipid/cholesterol/gamma-HCH transport system permease protein [Oceanimonas baumannii]